MDDLRWILLIVAIAIVVIVYVFNRVKKQDSNELPNQSIEDVPSFSADDKVLNDWVDGVGPVKILSSAEKTSSEDILEVSKSSSEDELISVSAEQVEINTHDSESSEDVAIDDVVSIYVLAKDKQLLSGEKILSASYALHIEHGEMKIFHRHSQNAEKQIQFSMANIQEPGWFNIDEMHLLKTKGVSFFMQVNLVEKPSEALSEMLICAHSMSKMLDATLCNAQRKPLDENYTNDLRKKVKRLEILKSKLV